MPKSEISFEAAVKELEKIIEKLESPDLTLTNALESFEKGVGLMKVCDAHLKTAEGKLKELVGGKDGEFIEKILNASVDASPDATDEEAEND
jgi:exodeoxyribonuclease VII small subunit